MSIVVTPHHSQTSPDAIELDYFPAFRRRGRPVLRDRFRPAIPKRCATGGECAGERSPEQLSAAGGPLAVASPYELQSSAGRTQSAAATFERAIIPHIGAAMRLARSLMSDSATAEDVVQDACLRAWRHFGSFKGENGRAWLLRIVRNVAFSRFRAGRMGIEIPLDAGDDDGLGMDIPDPGLGPEATLIAREDQSLLNDALRALPAHLRQCVELRVIDDLSYKEIAHIANIPLGTVMSRLFRARSLLQGRAAA